MTEDQIYATAHVIAALKKQAKLDLDVQIAAKTVDFTPQEKNAALLMANGLLQLS